MNPAMIFRASNGSQAPEQGQRESPSGSSARVASVTPITTTITRRKVALGISPDGQRLAGNPRRGSLRAPPFRRKARKPIRKPKDLFIDLKCGHLTTTEIDKLYSAWQPSGLPHYCETCSEYVRAKPKRKAKMPDEPPF